MAGSDSGDSGLLSLEAARGLRMAVCGHSSPSASHLGAEARSPLPGPVPPLALCPDAWRTRGGGHVAGAWTESGKGAGGERGRAAAFSSQRTQEAPQKPISSSIFAPQAGKARPRGEATSQGAHEAESGRGGPIPLVPAWIIDPQAAAQVVETVGTMHACPHSIREVHRGLS